MGGHGVVTCVIRRDLHISLLHNMVYASTEPEVEPTELGVYKDLMRKAKSKGSAYAYKYFKDNVCRKQGSWWKRKVCYKSASAAYKYAKKKGYRAQPVGQSSQL